MTWSQTWASFIGTTTPLKKAMNLSYNLHVESHRGLQDRLKEKLDQMEHGRIITKTDKPMDWVNSFVIVEKKDGSFRSCLVRRN